MIGIVIPCYRVKKHILEVLQSVGSDVERIYVIDDHCPEGTGKYVQAQCGDPRVSVLFNEMNLGVGGAVVAGYREAIKDGVKVVVKVDGDGQMDPSLVRRFVDPILNGSADYTKGNRFFRIDFLLKMPLVRKIGNSALSVINKIQSGYWSIMDPTNGYTAIHVEIIKALPLEKLDERYFFESDMLFRLSTIRAVIEDIPMEAKYGNEESNLKITKVILEFPPKYLSRTFKRIFYNYVLRDFNAGSIELFVGFFLLFSGTVFGGYHWYLSSKESIATPTGTIMLAMLPVILGFQLLLAFVQYDVASVPKIPLSRRLENGNEK
jgi:dolichol-phosphate mannosyltransferase